MRTVILANELAAAVASAKAAGKKVALVPTMGALHEGHLSLIAQAKKRAEFVVVSIFVNPLQFGQGEDFAKYPRTLEADAKLLAEVSADLLFAPTADVVYPNQVAGATQPAAKSAGPVGEILEGAIRPGHFDGMLTVVARLFDLCQPDIAVFGAKDAQQLFLIRRMAATDYPHLEIIEAETVREPSGLAMSSRNRYLDSEHLELAKQLSAALRFAKQKANTPEQALESARAVMAKSPAAKLEYIALVDCDSFGEIQAGFKGRALLLIAARVGQTRLIDNIEIVF